MSFRSNGAVRRGLRATVVAGLLAPLTVALPAAARADTAPIPPTTTATAAADVLPTVQVNGIVWSQLVVGNRVYATGEFTSARPAGSPAGQNETPRSNILAYDITTGQLITSWAPTLNAQGLTLAASTDGSKIFVGGDFNNVSGVNRYRVVALDATTGAVLPQFANNFNARVRTLVVSGDTVYAGGIFSLAGGLDRNRTAAFSATTGQMLDWNPGADDEVLAITAPPASGKIILGGRFKNLAGVANYGLGAVDPTTGANVPFPTNSIIRNAGADAAINSLANDGTRIFGSGYTFGGGGNLEHTFSSDVATGNLNWVSGCKGDTYSVAPLNGVLYSVGHPHDCSYTGAFPQSTPSWQFQRAMATTIDKSSTNQVNGTGTFVGRPTAEVLHWLPTLAAGNYTGQTQAAWTVTGNSEYVLVGGEFPSINGTAQQGLARFAVRGSSTNRQGPQGYADLTPAITDLGNGRLRISWKAAWDRDNNRLTYEVLRGPTLSTSTVVATMTADSAWWYRPQMAFVDTTATPGASVSYRIRVKDPIGNANTSVTTTGTGPSVAGTPNGNYATGVLGDDPIHYWRLGEESGTTARDLRSNQDLTLSTNSTRNVAGAITNDGDTATTFGGGTVPGATKTAEMAPTNFTVEAWFKTTSSFGGKIVGFGDRTDRNSGSYDRHVYMTNSGQLVFGVAPGSAKTIITPGTYRDGNWHHVVGTLQGGIQTLYVDGTVVGTKTDAGGAAPISSGYWRVGGDTIGTSWPSRPFSSTFSGQIDEVAVYNRALSPEAVASHRALGLGAAPNQDPTADFTSSVNDLEASFDGAGSADPDGSIASYAWDFGDGGTGTGATASHTYAAAGTYPVTLTVTDDRGGTATVTKNVTAVAPNQAPTAAFTATTTQLTASLDAGGSADPDGSIASYAWDFGDDSTGTGATATHTYAAGGDYTVTLTVTDNRGATASTTRTVTVAPPVVNETVAEDAFGRTTASGFGASDKGGAWTSTGSGVALSVADGSGRASVGAGKTGTQNLASVSSASTEVKHKVWLEAMPTGGGAYLSTTVRGSAGGDYRARLKLLADGTVQAQLSKVIGGAETVVGTAYTVSGLTYTAGTKLNVRVQAAGSAPTTLNLKVWADGTTEPANWQRSVTDNTAGLQGTGAVGFVTYQSSSATAALVVRFDDLVATAL
jgi:PKD repeat protein